MDIRKLSDARQTDGEMVCNPWGGLRVGSKTRQGLLPISADGVSRAATEDVTLIDIYLLIRQYLLDVNTPHQNERLQRTTFQEGGAALTREGRFVVRDCCPYNNKFSVADVNIGCHSVRKCYPLLEDIMGNGGGSNGRSRGCPSSSHLSNLVSQYQIGQRLVQGFDVPLRIQGKPTFTSE